MSPIMRRLYAVNFVRTMAVTTVAFLAPLRFLELGFGGAGIGVIVALFASAPLVFSFPTGWLNDRVSMKAVIGGALLSMSALFAAMTVVRDVAPMAAVFLLLGVANSAFNVSINSLYFKDGTETDPNRKYGRYVGWLSLGPPAGLLLGSFVARVAGFRTLLAIMAALTVLAAAAVRGLGEERFAAVSIRDYRFSVFNKRTLLFSAFLVLLALHWGTELTVYGPFLRTRLGLSDSGVALYMAGAYMALASAAFLVGRLKFDPGPQPAPLPRRHHAVRPRPHPHDGRRRPALVRLPVPPRRGGRTDRGDGHPDHVAPVREEDDRRQRRHFDGPPDLGPHRREPLLFLARIPGRAPGADDRRRRHSPRPMPPSASSPCPVNNGGHDTRSPFRNWGTGIMSLIF